MNPQGNAASVAELDGALRWLRGWLGARPHTEPAQTVVAEAQAALAVAEDELRALLDVAEAASDVLNHGLDHLSGQIKMADGSVQPCPLCLALDRFKAVSHA